MFNNTIDHPIALALLILSGLLAAPVTFISLWREFGRPRAALQGLANLGGVQLAMLWLGFIPLALLNRALGEPFVAVFGSYSQSTSLVDYVAAADLLAAIILLAAAACFNRFTGPVRAIAALLVVMLSFTAFEEAGLNKTLLPIPFPTDALHAPLVPLAYSLAGLFALVLVLAAVWGGARLKSRPSARFGLAVAGAPHVAALALTTAMLAQHPLFEEVAELSFAATLLQVLAVTALLTRPERLAASSSAAMAVQ